MPVELTTPVGRLVWGHPGKKTPKMDMTTKTKKLDTNGKEILSASFGVAFDKPAFLAHIWPVMQQLANALYAGGQVPQHFSWKFKDGDGVDRNGKPFNQREGYAGCFVLNFDTMFDLVAFRQGNGAWQQITADQYKTGDFIAVSMVLEANKPQNATWTPGMYVNPRGILHIGDGPLIVTTASPEQMFGGQQFQLPSGAAPAGSIPQIPQGQSAAPGMQAIPGQQPPQLTMQQQQPGVYGLPGGAPAYQQPAPAPQYQQQPTPQPQYQQQPAAGPQYQQQPMPGGAPQYQPAPDFVNAALGQQPGGAPVYQQQPASGGYPAAGPQYQQQQPMPGQQVAGMPPGFPGR